MEELIQTLDYLGTFVSGTAHVYLPTEDYDALVDELTDYIQFIPRTAEDEERPPCPKHLRQGMRFSDRITIYPAHTLESS